MKKYLFIILICCLFLTGCSKEDKNNLEKDKVLTEVEYFSNKIAVMLNSLNNISLQNYELVSEKVSINNKSNSGGSNQASSSSSNSQDGQSSSEESSQDSSNITVTKMQDSILLNLDTEQINWDLMKQEIESINTSWSIVMLDLYNNNVNNEDILAFSSLLNQTILSIKEENKATTLSNLCSLYSYIPKFLSITSPENSKQNLENTKYYIFTAYAAASLDDWNTANESLNNAESSFLNVVNDTGYSQNKEFKVNKTYMLIKDLQAAVTIKDKSLFFLKYKNLIETINQLT